MAHKQKRIQFTVGEKVHEDVLAIEEYYQEPVSQLFLGEMIKLVKEKALSLPKDFRKKVA